MLESSPPLRDIITFKAGGKEVREGEKRKKRNNNNNFFSLF